MKKVIYELQAIKQIYENKIKMQKYDFNIKIEILKKKL